MANIADKVAQIRQAVFGKEVRENIASGIEAINAEVISTTGRQNVIDSQEATRISNETIRQSNEANRITTFTNNEANREALFSTNEVERDAVIAQFKAWYDSSSLTGRLPFIVDGGTFGSAKTNTLIDGGSWN
jgi:hypothetical protein